MPTRRTLLTKIGIGKTFQQRAEEDERERERSFSFHFSHYVLKYKIRTDSIYTSTNYTPLYIQRAFIPKYRHVVGMQNNFFQRKEKNEPPTTNEARQQSVVVTQRTTYATHDADAADWPARKISDVAVERLLVVATTNLLPKNEMAAPPRGVLASENNALCTRCPSISLAQRLLVARVWPGR